MKKLTLTLTLALSSIILCAQTISHSGHHHAVSDPSPCGTSQAIEHLAADHPEFAEQFATEQANFQTSYEHYLESWSADDRSSYVIPVVVHVVHLGGPENISDEQIFNAIEQLNADFNMSNSDLGATIPEFSDITGNCDIEFRLATKAPNGQCHPGITRTYSETTYDEGTSGPSSHPIVEAVEDVHGNWPQNKYMNIFVCIDPSGAAGYTYRPTNWFPANRMYGSLFVRHDYMGVIGTSNSGRRHTLSHEAGHWLNLAHPWGGTNSPGLAGNCGTDDGVADTPNTIGWDNCLDVYGETCGSLDNVQNIMDYSYCSTMFTEGQAARVQTALLGATAERFKLSTAANLTATGTDGPGDLCEAQFSSNVRSICVGSTVDFEDLSYHTVTSRNWTFDGGVPATSALATPSVTYNTPGVYSVTLNVSNGGDSESKTETNYIVVYSNTGDNLPYSEGFETLASVPDFNRFIAEDQDGETTWELTTDAASSGSKSAKLGNYGITGGSRDALVSGTIDLSGVDPDDALIFNFKYAYNKRNADNDEWLRFYISKDCGETWVLRKNIHGNALSENVSGGPYTPGTPGEWTQVDVNTIFSDYFVGNFRYKFEFQNDDGNNIYIDDINLYPASMLSLTEEQAAFDISVYPNPLGNETSIQLSGQPGETYNITLYNSLGAQVTTVYNGELVSGNNTITWSTADLAKGVYVLKVDNGDQLETIKLIKN